MAATPMLITTFLHVRLKGHREHRNEVEFLRPAESLVGCLNRGHSDSDYNALTH